MINWVKSGSAHGLRNELCMWLKRLRWPVQFSRLFWARGWKCLRLMKTRERERTLSSQIAVEVKLIAQPVGLATIEGDELQNARLRPLSFILLGGPPSKGLFLR